MEDNQPIKQPNKLINYIKINRYNVAIAAAIAVLLLMIILLFIILANSQKNKKPNVPTPTPSRTGSTLPSPISNTPTIVITTPDPTQAAIIENQTAPQITPHVAVQYTVSDITQYGDNWGIMTITNPSVGNGVVIVKKVNNQWQVVLGPGSFFPEQQLQTIGAPQALIDHFTTPPTIAVSPSPVTNDVQ